MPRKYEVKCIHCNSDINREWLHTMKAILHPCVRGALNDTIKVHGPINEQWVGSAAKRITGALLTRLYEIDNGIDRTKIAIRKLNEEVIPDMSWPPIKYGTKVVTIVENSEIDDWSEEALESRQWGVQGTIIMHHDSHGLCYEVEHEDGTIGHYDPSELQVKRV